MEDYDTPLSCGQYETIVTILITIAVVSLISFVIYKAAKSERLISFVTQKLRIFLQNHPAQDMQQEESVILDHHDRFLTSLVTDVMTPRVDVVAIDINSTFMQVKEVIKNSGYSRFPVYENLIDNIVGIIYIKDLFISMDNDNFDWRSAIRKPYFVNESKKISDLLNELQKLRVHLAVVSDEYGSFHGITTMEDILEEIVGEIDDELDDEAKPYEQLEPNIYIFEGKTNIHDFEDLLEIEDDYFEEIKGDADSLGGLMLEVKGDLLDVGEEIDILDFKFIVLSISNRRIDKIKIVDNRSDDKI